MGSKIVYQLKTDTFVSIPKPKQGHLVAEKGVILLRSEVIQKIVALRKTNGLCLLNHTSLLQLHNYANFTI